MLRLTVERKVHPTTVIRTDRINTLQSRGTQDFLSHDVRSCVIVVQ